MTDDWETRMSARAQNRTLLQFLNADLRQAAMPAPEKLCVHTTLRTMMFGMLEYLNCRCCGSSFNTLQQQWCERCSDGTRWLPVEDEDAD